LIIMKLSKREQLLLGALLIALLSFGFYKLIYVKQEQKISELKISRDTYFQKWDKVKIMIASKNDTSEQYKTLNAKIGSKTDMLFPSINQEEIILILDKMLKDSNLQGEVLSFSEISIDNATEDISKDTSKTEKNDVINELDTLVREFNSIDKKDSSTEETNNNKVEPNKTTTDSTKIDNSKGIGAYKMQITLKFMGMYDELTSFIAQVENYDKNIIINNINLVGEEGSEVSGTIILDFYGVPKLDDNDYFIWNYNKPSGNGNPFFGASYSLPVNNEIVTNGAVSNGVVNNTEVNNAVKGDNNVIIDNVNDAIKSDFIMTAKPITSDLPTVTIEKAKDELKQSYVYSQNKGIEEVEIYFKKIGEAYFYKYKIGIETYPQNFNSYIEFAPNGENIILDIFSEQRLLDTDLSGANIKITNDTDKSAIVNILGDDKINPRVKIVTEKGDISVVRNYSSYSEK
jgi:type IV pilus assembly protein PilO